MTKHEVVCGIALVTSLLSLSMGMPAWADKVEGPYVGAGFTYTKIDDVTYDLVGAPVIAHPASFDGNSGLGLKVGWGFGGPRLEIEWANLGVDAKTFGRLGEIDPAVGKLNVDTWMANLLYDFDLDSKFVPYLGIGIGRADVKAKGISKNASLPDRTGFVDGGDNVFAWQAILGVAYQWNKHLGATLDYRYLRTGDIDHNYGVGCVPGSLTGCIFNGQLQMDYHAQTLALGLRWVF